MLMVREEQYLRLLRQLSQYPRAGCRPVIIEVYEEVVGDKRQRIGPLKLPPRTFRLIRYRSFGFPCDYPRYCTDTALGVSK